MNPISPGTARRAIQRQAHTHPGLGRKDIISKLDRKRQLWAQLMARIPPKVARIRVKVARILASVARILLPMAADERR